MFNSAYTYFMAVAKTNNFHKASEELQVSQPAISKQIKTMEEKLGYPLLNRTTRSVSLTEEGKILYAAMQECQEIMDEATEKITTGAELDQFCGTLRIGILSDWGADLFDRPYITGFFDSNPSVELYLVRETTDNLKALLKENKLDVVILPGREFSGEKNIRTVGMGSYPFLLILSKKHPLAAFDEIIGRIDGVNLYINQNTEKAVTDRFEKLGSRPRVVPVPNADSKIAAAEAGLGCTIVSKCSKASRSPKVRAYELPGVKIEVTAACRISTDALVNRFMDYLEALRKEPEAEIC